MKRKGENILRSNKRSIRSLHTFHNSYITLEELYTGKKRLLFILDATDCMLCSIQGLSFGKVGRPDCRCQGTGSNLRCLHLNIRAGMRDQQRIIYEKEGIRYPERRRGHLIITLQQQAHHVFDRRGHDLHMVLYLSKKESELNRFEKQFRTLDNRVIKITIFNGNGEDEVRNGVMILGEGMPILRMDDDNYRGRGQLFITFKILQNKLS